jgi:DNA-binding NarL/FixJ family response regulator
VGDRQGIATTLQNLGILAFDQRDYPAARAFHHESLALFKELEARQFIASSLEAFAALALAAGNAAPAARLFGAAEALRAAIGAPLPLRERASYTRNVAAARAHLGEQEFAAAQSEGRSMSLEQAVAYAFATSDAQHRPVAPRPASPTGEKLLRQKFGGLTPRQRQVAALIAQGKSNREIAEELVVTLNTVEAHIKRIFARLGVSSRVQIATWAVEKGLTQPKK